MAEKKKFDDSALKKAFAPTAPGWKTFYSDHEKASRAAYKVVKEDTTGLEDDEILDQVAKFLHAYHNKTGQAPDWDKMPEYQKQMYIGKAHEFLSDRNLWREKGVNNLDELMNQLQREGLTSIFEEITSNERRAARRQYGTSLIHKHVKPREQADDLYTHLKDVNPQLVGKSKAHTVKADIVNYLLPHYLSEHQQQQ